MAMAGPTNPVSIMQPTQFILESDRLGFRLMEEGDVTDLATLDTDPEVRAHFPDGVLTLPQIRKRIQSNREYFNSRGYCDFAVIHKDSGRFAGRAGFGDIESGEIEVGYVFLKEFWGQGLAQEALRALLAWAEASLSAKRILCYAPVAHFASLNVMAKSGMTYLKTCRMRGVDCKFYEYSF